MLFKHASCTHVEVPNNFNPTTMMFSYKSILILCALYICVAVHWYSFNYYTHPYEVSNSLTDRFHELVWGTSFVSLAPPMNASEVQRFRVISRSLSDYRNGLGWYIETMTSVFPGVSLVPNKRCITDLRPIPVVESFGPSDAQNYVESVLQEINNLFNRIDSMPACGDNVVEDDIEKRFREM